MDSVQAFGPGRGRIAARNWRRGVFPAALIALCAISVCVSLVLPVGFCGWDDLRYVQAAQRWLDEGVNVPVDHWGTRLPYVLTMAASIRLFGLSMLALTVPNTILFVVILLLLWRIGRQVFDIPAAFCSALVAATTPLYLRMPTTYYPEVVETALAAGATALTLSALRRSNRGRAGLLIAAGLVGGTGYIVRQTELVMPIALSLLILLVDRTRPRRAASSILLLACGYAAPVALETLFYLAITGNPLERLRIDSRHIMIPSPHLRGGTFKGGSPLFNWALAARWDVPSVVQVHWTINPIIRLFTSPGLLFTPWLCIAGMVAALRLRGLARSYAIFASASVLLQYGLNTFVLVIAPDTRYLLASIALMMPLAGLLLSRLPRAFRLFTIIVLMVIPSLLAMSIEPTPAHLIPALKRVAGRKEPIYVSSNLGDAATILLHQEPTLAPRIQPFKIYTDVPIGALAAAEPFGWTPHELAQQCTDGRNRWQPLETVTTRNGLWGFLDAAGLMAYLPSGLAARLQSRREHLMLVGRAC